MSDLVDRPGTSPIIGAWDHPLVDPNLEDAQIITRHREGRRNRYVVRRDVRFRHPLEAGLRVGDFVDLLRQRPRLRRLTSEETAPATVGRRDAR